MYAVQLNREKIKINFWISSLKWIIQTNHRKAIWKRQLHEHSNESMNHFKHFSKMNFPKLLKRYSSINKMEWWLKLTNEWFFKWIIQMNHCNAIWKRQFPEHLNESMNHFSHFSKMNFPKLFKRYSSINKMERWLKWTNEFFKTSSLK